MGEDGGGNFSSIVRSPTVTAVGSNPFYHPFVQDMRQKAGRMEESKTLVQIARPVGESMWWCQKVTDQDVIGSCIEQPILPYVTD